MARSTRGNLIGRARQAELRELREEIEEKYWAEQKEIKAREISDLNDAMRRCSVLEGQAKFMKFWLTLAGTRREKIEMIEKRIARIQEIMRGMVQPESESV